MGRKFENNKLKMAKTALAYAKKASYIGKKVVQAVKAGGDDPSINRQLAAVMAEVRQPGGTACPFFSNREALSAAPCQRAHARRSEKWPRLSLHRTPRAREQFGRRMRSTCQRTS